MLLKLPYGGTRLELHAPEDAAVLESSIGALRGGADGRAIVEAAMARPIDSPPLRELARGRKTCTVILSDHTRPVPSRDILPPMLAELREGNPALDITLLVATGFHRPTTGDELACKLGPELAGREKIAVHDSEDPKANVRLGVLPSGAPLIIDRLAAETDLLVAEGFIEPHFFAGFSGGRKSVLPGVCSRATVLGNHCSAFIDSPFARTGILDGNPLHRDMLAAARMAKLSYIVNVVINERKDTVAAFAGNFETAHRAGCDFLRSCCAVKSAPADIVIATNGGAPLDQNLYQCVKGMTAAEATAKPGGIIILCAECADGTGGDGFYRSLRDCEGPEQLYASIMATPQEETIPDQWEAQVLARILRKHQVIFVTRPALEQTVTDMKMTYAPSMEHALDLARSLTGPAPSLTVIPNGIAVIVEQ